MTVQVRLQFQGRRIRDDASLPIVAKAPTDTLRTSGRRTMPPANQARSPINPKVALVTILTVTAHRLPAGASLGTISLQYESVPRKFSRWAADDAGLLRREFELARQELLEALLVNATRQGRPVSVAAK